MLHGPQKRRSKRHDHASPVISPAPECTDSITEQEGRRRHRGIDELLRKEEEIHMARHIDVGSDVNVKDKTLLNSIIVPHAHSITVAPFQAGGPSLLSKSSPKHVPGIPALLPYYLQ
jgi:hypothetical protein